MILQLCAQKTLLKSLTLEYEAMKAETHETFELILTLNREEAEWLKGYMQNPKTEVELPDDYEYRKDLFTLLKSKGV